MRTTIRKDGYYEMFQTKLGHAVICLDKQEWYARIKNYLIRTAPDQPKSKELVSGKYLLVESDDNPGNEFLHLYLLKAHNFEELLLPSQN